MRRQVGLSCWTICVASVFAVGMESALARDNGAPAASRESRVKFVINGQILAIDDGDTLRMQNAGGQRIRIRLSDLDAPEVAHKKNPYVQTAQGRRRCRRGPARAVGQAGGTAAAQALRALAASSAPARAECYEKDNFGRSVCHVFVGGINLNLDQLRTGQAMLAPQARWIRDARSKVAEQKARSQRLGIWSRAPLPPSEWRTRCWCEGNCAGSSAATENP